MYSTEQVDEVIANVMVKASALAKARATEMNLEDERASEKTKAIARIMGSAGGNTLTGKPHSVTSAEAIVETDERYAVHRICQRNALVARIEAEGAYFAAKCRAALLTALATVDA